MKQIHFLLLIIVLASVHAQDDNVNLDPNAYGSPYLEALILPLRPPLPISMQHQLPQVYA